MLVADQSRTRFIDEVAEINRLRNKNVVRIKQVGDIARKFPTAPL
jgi:hypothetical protein